MRVLAGLCGSVVESSGATDTVVSVYSACHTPPLNTEYLRSPLSSLNRNTSLSVSSYIYMYLSPTLKRMSSRQL